MSLNYYFPASLMKTGEEKEGRIPIRIIPNSPSIDRQNDKIILKAFSQTTIDDYLNTSKVIDYDHKSILGKNDLEKSKAIIGEAESLFVDSEKNIPICDGFLFKDNPFVSQAIYPALKSGSRVYGASIGGKILQKSVEEDPKTKKRLNVISKISLNHIAICPLNKAVNTDTTVSLRKSKNKEDILMFNNFDSFMKSFTDAEDLRKALIAGSATDISNLSGGQALQQQSLEGSRVNLNKIKYTLPFILENVLTKSNNLYTVQDYMKYLVTKGFNEYEAIETISLLAKNGAKIVELFI